MQCIFWSLHILQLEHYYYWRIRTICPLIRSRSNGIVVFLAKPRANRSSFFSYKIPLTAVSLKLYYRQLCKNTYKTRCISSMEVYLVSFLFLNINIMKNILLLAACLATVVLAGCSMNYASNERDPISDSFSKYRQCSDMYTEWIKDGSISLGWHIYYSPITDFCIMEQWGAWGYVSLKDMRNLNPIVESYCDLTGCNNNYDAIRAYYLWSGEYYNWYAK